MLIRPAVLNFEKMGFGMFVHFGLYSVHGKGEWAKFCLKIDDKSYDAARKQFCPKADWAAELVRTAKDAGCRYITLTTRHHDGYSLYDTCGLNEYDTVHDCGRDLVREFVDACRAGGIVPFFYHTLLDWHEKTYQTDFLAYLRYLRSSVELLCRNYGEIGGFWFDGKWNKPDADWEEDALYGMIRRYQPDTILINNTGLEGRGQLGNIELDSVTFERGKPQPINLADSPKYIASEMCEVTCGGSEHQIPGAAHRGAVRLPPIRRELPSERRANGGRQPSPDRRGGAGHSRPVDGALRREHPRPTPVRDRSQRPQTRLPASGRKKLLSVLLRSGHDGG